MSHMTTPPGLAARLRSLHAAGQCRPAPPPHADSRITPGMAFKPASVLVAFTDRPRPGLLFIQRPETMRAHPGQIAFPGGRAEPGESAVAAALRESHEELGIAPEAVEVIGTGDLYHTGSGYAITPVLAVVPAGLALVPNAHEVADWFEAPADYVLAPANQHLRRVRWQGAPHQYIEILWQERRIWGVTGAILANLAQRLQWPTDHG